MQLHRLWPLDWAYSDLDIILAKKVEADLGHFQPSFSLYSTLCAEKSGGSQKLTCPMVHRPGVP